VFDAFMASSNFNYEFYILSRNLWRFSKSIIINKASYYSPFDSHSHLTLNKASLQFLLGVWTAVTLTYCDDGEARSIERPEGVSQVVSVATQIDHGLNFL
jgi:hypothetical protein